MTGQLAFVESPVQLLNVLEWSHARACGTATAPDTSTGPAAAPEPGAGHVPGTAAEPPGRSRAFTPGTGLPAATSDATGAGLPAATSDATGVGLPAATSDATGAGLPAATGAGLPAATVFAAEAGLPGLPALPAQRHRQAGAPPEPSGGQAGVPAERVGGAPAEPPGGQAAVLAEPPGAFAAGASGAGEETRPTPGLTIVVLSPTDPMSRGQLRRMAQLARDEGFHVRWQEARGGRGALVRTLRELAPLLRAADRVIVGDPFSRYVQLLLTLFGPRRLTVVDDGTATMEFAAQLARGERLVRWHRRGSRGPRELVLAPVSALARRRLAPTRRRSVEIFTSLPVEPPPGTTVTPHTFAWTRARFGPPRLTRGADLVGTSLVETGVVDADRYTKAVADLAHAHGATRYFAHRRESTEKLHRIAVETGLEIVRPELPLEVIARRGPIGRTVVSFPSTVVHTLPLALEGTGVKVAVCEIAPEWLRENVSPRARGFLAGVAGTAALEVDRLTTRATPAVERLEFG